MVVVVVVVTGGILVRRESFSFSDLSSIDEQVKRVGEEDEWFE